MAGFIDNSRNGKQSSFFRRIRKLNDGGWNYIDNIVTKSHAIGQNEFLSKTQFSPDEDLGDILYDFPGVYKKDSIDVTYDAASEYQKNEYLEEIAGFDEIDFVLNTIADECVIYGIDNKFANLNLSEIRSKFALKEEIINKIDYHFQTIYYLFRFNEGDYAWRLFKDWLIVGKLAFEVIFDENKKNIIGFKRLDPFSLKLKIEKIGGKYIKYWVQYEGQPRFERQLTDDEIIYINYNDSKKRRSYLETIIRRFNILRTLEDTRVIWGIMHSVLRMRMVVPINTKSEQRSKIKVGELRNRYKEVVNIDKTSGEVTYNGKTNLALFQNYIFPSQGGDEISIEPVINNFNDAISVDELEYFSNKFKMTTKIPFNRFETDGGFTFDLTASIENQEFSFDRFKDRLKNTFKEIIIKPLMTQLKLDIPELMNDVNLWNTINIEFHQNNRFEELKEMEITEKRIDFINNLSDITIKKWQEDEMGGDFVEESFFSSHYLISKYMKITPEEIAKNNEFKIKYGEVKPSSSEKETEETEDLGF